MEKTKVVLGGLLGMMIFLFGRFDAMIMTLLAFCFVDFVTGILKAVVEKNVDSHIMFVGGVKKAGIFFVIAVANLADNMLSMGGVLRSVSIGYYAANEGISILENWGKMGLPLPSKLKAVLRQLMNDEPERD